MENKRLKCDKCGWVKATNVFNDDRFYCRECGKNLGCYKLKQTDNKNKE